MQRTLVLVKPDAVQRGLAGEVISRLERKGLKLVGVKMMRVDESLARQHYEAHVERPFFPSLLAFITSSPIVALAVEGPNAIDITRGVMGATNPLEATPGSIRGDMALSVGPNLIHGSDSEEAAARELALFFGDDELLDYTRDMDRWIIES
jgi:nucleoside-diphosphate kinase